MVNMEVIHMYVETVGNPIGSKMPVKMQQVAQTDVSNTIHAESTEGKAEYKNYESTREEIFKEIEEQENIINGTKPKKILIDEFE